MAAPKGNKYWENRKKHGRDKIIKTPEELWSFACDYFQWVDDNPWVKTDFRGKDADEVEIPTQRPYTWDGLDNYLFLEIGISKLEDYKSNREGRYKDFVEVITRIGKVINNNKMEGAIVGAYNANIIARDLGLKDKTENEHKIKKLPDIIEVNVRKAKDRSE